MYLTRLDMIGPIRDHDCIKGILISEEVTLTKNGTDYVVPKGTGFILYLSDGELKNFIDNTRYSVKNLYIYFILSL